MARKSTAGAVDGQFVKLFDAARQGVAQSADDRTVFLDTLRVCEQEGAQRDEVYKILNSAVCNFLTDKWRTREV